MKEQQDGGKSDKAQESGRQGHSCRVNMAVREGGREGRDQEVVVARELPTCEQGFQN